MSLSARGRASKESVRALAASPARLAAATAHAADVALCQACLCGDPAAIRHLEREHFPALRATLRRYLGPSDAVEEVLQTLRERLLVGPRPRLASYQGSGPLGGWLRTAARRGAIDHLRSARRQRASLREQGGCESHGDPSCGDFGTWSFAESYALGERIGQALDEALRELSRDDRALVRAYYVDDHPVERFCEEEKLHRATAYRRLHRCERQLRRRLRQLARGWVECEQGEDLDAVLRDAPAWLDLGAVVRTALTE